MYNIENNVIMGGFLTLVLMKLPQASARSVSCGIFSTKITRIVSELLFVTCNNFILVLNVYNYILKQVHTCCVEIWGINLFGLTVELKKFTWLRQKFSTEMTGGCVFLCRRIFSNHIRIFNRKWIQLSAATSSKNVFIFTSVRLQNRNP